jgi:general stress protein YciG
MRLPPRQRIPMVEGYQLVGEPPLGEAVGPQIPERDSFLILRANEAFLQVIVVSHEDVSKICASAAPLPPAKSPAELGREGGKENAERIAALADIPSAAEAGRKGGWRKQALQREEKPLWHFDLVRIANAARKDDPSIFNKDIIEKVKSECDRRGIPHPEPRQMLSVLSDFITKGNIPRRKK